MIELSLLIISTTILVYLTPLDYSILQLTINTAKPPKTVGVYSKSLPFELPSSYLLMSTYMMFEYFVSFFLILPEFVSSILILNSSVLRLFPLKVFWARPILPTHYNNPKEFISKYIQLAPGRWLIRLGLISAIAMKYSIPYVDLLKYQSFKKELWSNRGNHGFLMAGNLKSTTIQRLWVALE